MFCGWGAEEYGMIGSYEWAEEHSKVLSQRAVAYINVDSAMEGDTLFIIKNVLRNSKAILLHRKLYIQRL